MMEAIASTIRLTLGGASGSEEADVVFNQAFSKV